MIKQPLTNFRRILVANRSEIAIRVFRVSVELGVETIAICSQEDRFALHRFKTDEAYLIGRGMGPIEAYLSIEEVIRVARANAVIADLLRNGGTGGGIPPLPLIGRAGPVAEHPCARVCPHLPSRRSPGRMAGSPCDTMDRPFLKNGEFPENSINLDKFR